MYRVLFAEDELLVRMGLQNAVDWKKYDMELVAQADNGKDAYQLFLKLHPEVVITDIRMEGMDGYELIRRIREIDRKCAIMVISCLDDFESLRKMMGYNISGYILKASMTMDEIHQELEKVKAYLEQNVGTRMDGMQKESLDEMMTAYLTEKKEEDWSWARWKDGEPFRPEQIQTEVMFSLKEEDRGKISDLGKKFVYDLAEKYLNRSVIVRTGDDSFCVLTETGEEKLEESLSRMKNAIHTYLGVEFDIRAEGIFCSDRRKYGETLRNVYRKLEGGRKDQKQREAFREPLIERAVRYMELNFQKPLGLGEISGYLGISSSYFSHLFKKETGKTYVEYLNELRLHKVLEELKNSNMKLSVIAERNGFNNLEYFSRFFKKHMGVSPAKWRQQNRG